MGHFISFTVTFGGFKVNKIIAVRDLCPVHQNIVPVLHAGLVDPLLAVRALLVYLAVQFIENQFIYPRVVGKSVGLSPLYTLVAAMIGGKLFGILGILFFIPLTAVVLELVKEDAFRRLRTKETLQ